MKLRELYRGDVEEVRKWRNEDISAFRTPYLLTQGMQQEFYDEVIANCDSKHRFWAVEDNLAFIGMAGLTNIQWENSIAEISLIIKPAVRNYGFGEQTVWLLLKQAFNRMNLKTVFGECYMCGPVDFWKKIAGKYEAFTTGLPARKFWDGKYWGSFYFSIDCDEYRRIHPAIHET